jgi:hypothetical protein
MKKLLLCIGLLAISSFINGAADKHKLRIVWKMGISGKITMPDREKESHSFPYISNEGELVCSFFPRPGASSPLFLYFDKNSVCRDEDRRMLEKRATLCPRSGEPTIVSVELPKKYAAWDQLPYGTKIYLCYWQSTKVAASLQLPMERLQVSAVDPKQMIYDPETTTLRDDTPTLAKYITPLTDLPLAMQAQIASWYE